MEKKEEQKKDNVKKGKASNSQYRLKSRHLHVVMLLLLVAILAVLGYVYLNQGVDEEDEDMDLSIRLDILDKLRGYEIEWDDHMKKKWEDRRTHPPSYAVPYALYEVPRFESDQAVFSVGDEVLYTNDVNYELFAFHNPEFRSGEYLSDELLLLVIDDLIDESVTLQRGEEETMVRLYTDYFDSVDKDQKKRNKVRNDVESMVEKISVYEVDGETISVWFYNMEPPEMGVEEAREYAEELISDLHQQIVDGDLTMEEAGRIIREDPVVIQVDFGVSANAHSGFRITGDQPTFHDPLIQEKIEALDVDEVSDVLVGRDGGENRYDAFFMVALVNEKQDGVMSLGDWLTDTRNMYKVAVVE